MARYFIDTDDGDATVRDEIGHDLENAEAARELAHATLPDMVSDVMPDGDQRRFSATVRDADGALVYRATLTLEGQWMNAASPAKVGLG